MASSSFYILDVVSYQDLSRPSASLAHCCIHDNLYFLAYFAFLNHKCKTKATKTNQVEKKLLKKAVSTALWIHMILFACYLPLFFFFLFFCFFVVGFISFGAWNTPFFITVWFLLLNMLRTRQMENLKLVYRLKNIYIYISRYFRTPVSIRHDKKVANRTGCQTSLQVH